MKGRFPTLHRFLARMSKRLIDNSGYRTAPYWIAAFLTGLVAVGYAKLFKLVELGWLHLFETNRHWMYLLSPLCFLGAWALVHWLAPAAAGSGIPQVMAAIDMDQAKAPRAMHALLGLRTVVVKILSSLLCVLGGGAIGREGPTIQIAAAIFHGTGRRVERILPNTFSHQSLIVAGAAAGIASAFNTPLGGIVYAIEEIATTHFTRFRTPVILAVIVSGLVAQAILGPYLYLGYPRLSELRSSTILLAALVGVVAGAAGAAFGKALLVLVHLRAKLKSWESLALLAMACGLLMAAMSSVAGSIAAGPGNEAITELLFRGAHADWSWVLSRWLGSMISYLSGCAGGIFAPSLATGAAIGSFLGELTHTLNPKLMTLLGMIAFLTGVTRAPFTAFVLVLEMTDRHAAVFPMMLSALLAHATGRTVDRHSFYEHMKRRFLKPGTENLK